MKIIGHRGAAGLALENTLPSIELARLLGVDAIEFDVRKTKDNQLVLVHDADMDNVSKSNAKVGDLTLKQLKKIKLKDEHSNVPTLQEALSMAGDTPVIIELKSSDCAELLLKTLGNYHRDRITVASFKLDELARLRSLDPEIRLFALERTNPFEIIQLALRLNLTGIGLNFWLLNPLTYVLAKRHKLELFVYTLNSRILGHFVKFLYPDTAVCTDHPEWYIKHPWLKLRSSGFEKPVKITRRQKRKRLKKR